ncbi:MAG: ABC transporter permease subunit [Elusimicrobia bacterium]|nr:ABC transporter permease subunit [Elusimicrobiota bacterium]
MRNAALLAANTWRELTRTRFVPLIVLFGAVLIYLGMLLGVLAGDVEDRVLLDVGMAVIELMTCSAVAYCAATGLLQEMEQKTLYLILSRPVGRPAYLVGRFLGAFSAAATAAVAMTAALAVMLLCKGGLEAGPLLLSLWGVLLKAFVTAGAATFLALISTSVLSAMTMTGIVWVLGHFVGEIRFLAQRTGSASAVLLVPVTWLLPNFSLLNYRDRLHAAGGGLSEPLLAGMLYAVLYAAVCMGLTSAVFRRKEF